MISDQEKQYLIDTVFDGDLDNVGNDLAIYQHKRELWDELFLSTEVRGRQINGYNLFLFLGYIPLVYFSKEQKPFISGLFNDLANDTIDSNQMFDTAMSITKQLRNDDMKYHSEFSYNWDVYHQYFNHLPQLQDTALKRLKYFLADYEVLFESSVMAELMLREAINEGKIHFEPKNNNFLDTRVLTLTIYRDILYHKGLQAANESALIAPTITEKILKRHEAKV